MTRQSAATDQLAVLTTLYQSARAPSAHRIANYWRARLNWEAAGVTVFTVESAVPGATFISPRKNSWHVYREPGVHPWLKEHLLNYGIRRIPHQYNKIAWLDADILFGTTFWPEQACEILNHTPFIQMFDIVEWLGPDGQAEMHLSSCTRNAHLNGGPTGTWHSKHPGMGWAATRDFLEATNGLFWQAGSMSGDAIMASAFELLPIQYRFLTNSWAYNQWCDAARAAVSGLPGYLEGQVIRHLWHGDAGSRNYGPFDQALEERGFDPDRDLIVFGDDGGQLTCHRPEINEVFQHFGCY